MIFDILTIFPDLLDSPLNEAIIRRAKEAGQVHIAITNIRDFATDKHSMTDDRPFGGGEGMVMKPEPLKAAIDSVKVKNSSGHVVLLSPQGRQYNQKVVQELSSKEHLILICGRYEGVDKRLIDANVDDEISIGDYILTGGELAAMIIVDSVTRVLPGVLGCSDSAEKDTFSRKLLKHPQYTRPRTFEGVEIPQVLLSGDHARIEQYRFLESVRRTLARRPDLIAQEYGSFSKDEVKLLKKHQLFDQIRTTTLHTGP
ncbi:MAG: tRNA (guanosine(37)-N1)-methyltransferase TrmD [Desulfocapsa sp.]|uniref:tRNA (guanine-N(1)-)-methyltransferase n=1 Tax=Desulfotalea psychrophila TaxID=84980 RepID=A0ABS3AUN7_9BACT|nr:tRNA (guanosine(37)-N1)-methyltransferase TrmD [Desulfocapsa sp.]MBN4048908.1 tRNA (guanosine(37)-N1)-methyltransferase TrmD [bacterium AH-315-N22]MBN4068818.1 tRNA (guanosine(37)-N1)-methyltransferase TrmD [Desulfotalea psychrophila]